MDSMTQSTLEDLLLIFNNAFDHICPQVQILALLSISFQVMKIKHNNHNMFQSSNCNERRYNSFLYHQTLTHLQIYLQSSTIQAF